MNFISSWAQGIIISVIIATIIEMLLPNNSSSKYIKVVVGVFVLFSIISPVVSKLKGNDILDEINMDSYIEKTGRESIQTSTVNVDNNKAIKKIYEENLKIDIKSKISQKGYTVGEVNLDISDNSEYTINKIEIKITAKNETSSKKTATENTTTIVENIENIKISLGGSRKDEKKEEQSIISESEKRKLREYVGNVYEVSENNIQIL